MNEAETRAEKIDPKLDSAGWRSDGQVKVYREYQINAGAIRSSGFRDKASVADYVLAYKNQKLASQE